MSSLHIIEAGPASFINASGTGCEQCNLNRHNPRILIVEPGSNVYLLEIRSLYQWQNKFNPQYQIVEADIYAEETQNLISPHIAALIFLGSVIDDPVSDKGNFETLADLFEHCLAPGGIVIMSTTSHSYTREYEEIRNILLQNPNFRLLMDELVDRNTYPSHEYIFTILESMDAFDEALANGLEKEAQKLWMVFQRI